MLIDSHAHLEMLPDAAQARQAALAAGVKALIAVGVDLASSRQAARYARTYDNVFFSVGVHPHDAAKTSPADWRELELLARQGAVAVGECGLDFYRDLSPRPQQREVFTRQVELALQLNLPLIVHDRDAHQEVADMLQSLRAHLVGGVLHCFSGDWALAKKMLDLGFCLGIAGVLTYPKNQVLRDLVKKAPLESLLLETDCPYLSPAPLRGKPNQPSHMVHTWQALARALGKDPHEVARITTENCVGLFRLPQIKNVPHQ